MLTENYWAGLERTGRVAWTKLGQDMSRTRTFVPILRRGSGVTGHCPLLYIINNVCPCLCPSRHKVDGKTGERVVRFGLTTAKALLKYMMVRDNLNGHNDRLWLTSEGNTLKAYSVETLFIRLKKKTGIHVNPHLLRHTFATHLMNQGADIRAVKDLLGHANLSTTQIYTHTSIDHLKAIYAQAHPSGSTKSKKKKEKALMTPA